MTESVDITRGLLTRLQLLSTQNPHPTECEDIRNASFSLFKETNVNSDISPGDCNTLVSLVVELTKRDQVLKSFEVIVEAWKFYIKILKAHSTMLTANICNEVSNILTKCASEGISTFVAQPSDPGLSFLFFYLQRISATLSYCVHIMAEPRAIDMIYLLCAARGVLELPVASNSNLSVEMKGKMETNFMKAIITVNEMNEVRHTGEVNIFYRAMHTCETQSAWSYLPRLSLCRSLGACRLLLYATTQQHCQFHLNISLLETLVALLAVACCYQFEALSDRAFKSIIDDITTKYAIMLCDNNSSKDTKKEVLVDLLRSYRSAADNGVNIRGQIYELVFSSIVSRLDENSQRSILSICQKMGESNPCDYWFNLLKSLLLTVQCRVSIDVITKYAMEETSGTVSHRSPFHEKFVSSCLYGQTSYDAFVNTVTSSPLPTTAVKGIGKGDVRDGLFVLLNSSKHLPQNLRNKFKLKNCEDLLNKAIALSDFLVSVIDRMKTERCPLFMKVEQKLNSSSYSPNKLCFLDALIAFDTLCKITMAVTSQSTIINSNDRNAFIDNVINVCEVLANVCAMCFAYTSNISLLFQSSKDPPSMNIQAEMDISIKTSISACNCFKNILINIVKSDFKDSQLEKLKKIFEILSSYLFSGATTMDWNETGDTHMLSIDKYVSQLHIILLDCCYEFAENLQPKLQVNAALLFPAQILSIIKARNKERKGRGENIFINSNVNVQRKVIATICTSPYSTQGHSWKDANGGENALKRMKR